MLLSKQSSSYFLWNHLFETNFCYSFAGAVLAISCFAESIDYCTIDCAGRPHVACNATDVSFFLAWINRRIITEKKKPEKNISRILLCEYLSNTFKIAHTHTTGVATLQRVISQCTNGGTLRFMRICLREWCAMRIYSDPTLLFKS